MPPAISVTVRPTKLPPPPRFFIAPETNTCRVLSHNLLCHFVIVMRAKCSLALLLSLSGVHFPWDVFIIFIAPLSLLNANEAAGAFPCFLSVFAARARLSGDLPRQFHFFLPVRLAILIRAKEHTKTV